MKTKTHRTGSEPQARKLQLTATALDRARGRFRADVRGARWPEIEGGVGSYQGRRACCEAGFWVWEGGTEAGLLVGRFSMVYYHKRDRERKRGTDVEAAKPNRAAPKGMSFMVLVK